MIKTSTTKQSADPSDRRTSRRLEIRMPIELTGRQERSLVRTVTRNIGTGGFYVELDRCDFQPGEPLQIELTVPSSEGVSPFPGRARCTGEVTRTEEVDSAHNGAARVGVGVRFLERLRFEL